MKFNSAFILLLLIAISSCKKEESCKASSVHRTSIGSCLKTFMFDEGSFWVYNNTQNTALDSVTVESCQFEIDSYKSGPDCEQSFNVVEFISTDFKSSLNENYTRWMYNGLITPEKLSPYENRLYDCSQVETIDQLSTPAGTFYFVQKIEKINPDSKLYYKQDVGIIRKVVFDANQDSIVYDLIEYNCIPFTISE